MSATAMPGVGPDTKRAGQEAAEAGHTGETPVFAAPDGRRGRRLRTAALVLSALVTLWLAGLVAGLLGFDALPALHVPGAPVTGTGDVSPRASALPVSAHARRALQAGPAASSTTGSATTRPATSVRSPRQPAATRRIGSITGPQPTSNSVKPAPAAAPQSPATTAPAASPGRRVGQTTTGTGNQTTKATPPGQAKEVKGPAAPTVAHGRPADAGPKPKF